MGEPRRSEPGPNAGGKRRCRLTGWLALLAGATVALAGCGSSNPGGTSADPATVVPATAALYAGASVRPQGSLKTDALAAARALTHQADPYLRLLDALQTPGSPKLSFPRDVAPWLGPNAGVFLTSLHDAGPLTTLLEQGLLGSTSAGFPFGGSGAQGALVLDTSNREKASAFLHTQAAHAGAHATSYRGVSYETSSGGVAFALVDRFAVIGSETGVRAVIETSKGASPLAPAASYSALAVSAPAGALAQVYSSPSPSASSASAPGLLRALAGSHAASISLVPAPASLALDADSLASGSSVHAGGLLAADPQAAQALDELPGESWLALGLGQLGTTIGQDAQDIQALASLGTGEAPTAGLSFGSLLQGLITPLRALGANSAQAQREFASWMGSGGVFASGSNLVELKAGVAITSTDPARSRAAVSELAGQLRSDGASVSPVSIPGTEAALSVAVTGLPVKLDLADGRASDGQTKFVIGVGEASVAAALDPPSTLASAASRTQAASDLGEAIQPSLMFDFPTFLGLLEGIGLLEQPPIGKFLPYLRTSTTLVGGGRQLSDQTARFKLVLGLQTATGEGSPASEG
jgi:hypothetical protein